MFPFARFPGTDPVLSPEMKSTGEVMGIDSDFAKAFLKSQLGAGLELPLSGTLFVSVKDSDKAAITAPVRALARARLQGRSPPAAPPPGWPSRASRSSGSTRSRRAGRISSTGSRTASVDIVFNTTEGWQSHKDFGLDPRLGGDGEGALLHHRGVERGGGAGDRGARGAQP